MIVLDTDVLSALMRNALIPLSLRGSMYSSYPNQFGITAVTVFEIHFGLELLAPGRRRRQLGDAFSRVLEDDFQGRILPFDREAAQGSGKSCSGTASSREDRRFPAHRNRRHRFRKARDAYAFATSGISELIGRPLGHPGAKSYPEMRFH